MLSHCEELIPCISKHRSGWTRHYAASPQVSTSLQPKFNTFKSPGRCLHALPDIYEYDWWWLVEGGRSPRWAPLVPADAHTGGFVTNPVHSIKATHQSQRRSGKTKAAAESQCQTPSMSTLSKVGKAKGHSGLVANIDSSCLGSITRTK